MSKILLDTSAWVEFFRPDGDVHVRNLIFHLIDENEVAICGMILAELLKGTRSDSEYQKLETHLSSFPYFNTPEKLWKHAGHLASQLRKKGVQVPMTDLIIAMVAMEYDLSLLHYDKHYTLLEKHTSLKIYDSEVKNKSHHPQQ